MAPRVNSTVPAPRAVLLAGTENDNVMIPDAFHPLVPLALAGLRMLADDSDPAWKVT